MIWDINSEQNSEKNMRFLTARVALFSRCNFLIFVSFIVAILFSLVAVLTPAASTVFANTWAMLTLFYTVFEAAYIDRLIAVRAVKGAGLAEEFDCRVFEIERNENFGKQDTDHEIDTLSSKFNEKEREKIRGWYNGKLGEVPKPVAALIGQYTSTAYDQGLRSLYLRILWFALLILGISILAYISYEDQKFRNSIVTFAVPFLPITVWLIKAIVANCLLVASQNDALKIMEHQWELVKKKLLTEDALAVAVRDNQDALYCRRVSPSLVFPKLYALYRPTLEGRAARTAEKLVEEYLDSKAGK
jgi:hypothetical protein